MPYIFGKLWHLALIWAFRKAFQCILQGVRFLLANHTRLSPTSDNESYEVSRRPSIMTRHVKYELWYWKTLSLKAKNLFTSYAAVGAACVTSHDSWGAWDESDCTLTCMLVTHCPWSKLLHISHCCLTHCPMVWMKDTTCLKAAGVKNSNRLSNAKFDQPLTS